MTVKNVYYLEEALQKAASDLLVRLKVELDMAKEKLSEKNYHSELTRIAWVNRSNISGASHSTTNLTQNIWRQEALDRLHRWGT